MDVLQVFVSSTFDLQAERRAIEEELRGLPYKVFLYEDEPALPATPESHCLRSIQESRLVVLLAGPRYGSVVEATKPRSVTEWEFDTARSEALCLPVFGFVRADAFHSEDKNQRRFIERIQAFEDGVSRDRFATTDELKRKVSKALHRWNLEFRLAREGARRRISEYVTQRVTQVLLTTVVAFIFAMTVWEVERKVFVTVCLLLATAILCGLALIRFVRKDTRRP